MKTKISSKNFSRQIYLRVFFIGISTIFLCYFLLYSHLPSSSINGQGETSSNHFLLSERFELFWTIWTRNATEFRGRRRLVLDSIFIHHPRATIRIYSSTLNDTALFFPYRQRGFKIFVFNFSTNEISNFHRHDGIFFDLNSIFLRSLRNDEILVENSSIISIFDPVDFDTSLQLADLSQRSFSIRFSDDDEQRSIARGSLIDLLLNRYDLCESRSINSSSSVLIHPVIYIVTRRKQGRFNGRDVIYLRTKIVDQRWNLSITVVNGTIRFPIENQRLDNLNQAELNWIFHQIIYRPSINTTIDTMTIELKNFHQTIKNFFTILIFHRYVSILTKTMGTEDRWPVVQRLIASVEKYFAQTPIHIASDSGAPIDRSRFLNSSIFDEKLRRDLTETLFFHDLSNDSGLSRSRNHLVDRSETSFVFVIDDDFVFDDDSHLDILLEIIFIHPNVDLIAGKIPEDIEIYHDFAGFFLIYNETLELVDEIPREKLQFVRFQRNEEKSSTNPCRQVDFVPNVFLGRREILASIRWDDEFKLAEHEDFFLRFAQSNRTVFTCRHISFHHRQEPWWTQIERSYYKRRARVYEFYKKMLKKHRLKRLISFDVTNLDLDEIKTRVDR